MEQKKANIILGGVFFVIILITTVVFLWVGGYFYTRVYIEQKVKIDSVLDDTYRVQTIVWIWRKGDNVLEKVFGAYSVPCKAIPEHKAIQLLRAEQIVDAVHGKLKIYEDCRY